MPGHNKSKARTLLIREQRCKEKKTDSLKAGHADRWDLSKWSGGFSENPAHYQSLWSPKEQLLHGMIRELGCSDQPRITSTKVP